MKCIPIILATFMALCQLEGATHLSQADFVSGTYRIQRPDTYILDEDIQFQPIPAFEQMRSDKPATGWFAAITVEANDVVLDLNGKTLEASQQFVDERIFKVFANIELDNSPFSGVLFGLVGASFQGDTSYVAASNVTIKNGTLGRSSHWGIHGNSNANIRVKDVVIKDFEVAAVECNGLIGGSFSDVKISGTEHIVRVTPLVAAADSLLAYLEELTSQNYPGAANQLIACTQYVTSQPEFLPGTSSVVPSSIYGMIFTSGFPAITHVPITPEECEFGAFLAGGRTVSQVDLHNVSMHNLKAAPVESVLIGSSVTGGVFASPALIGLPIFGCPRWQDAFDGYGNFAPNDFIKSQIFAVNAQIALNPELTGSLPPNYQAIADSILNGDEEAFLQESMPLFGLQLDSFIIKGAFGLRLDCAEYCSVKKCDVSCVENIGDKGHTLNDIARGSYYSDLNQTAYLGNISWGYEFANVDHVRVTHSKAEKILSKNSDSFGFDLAGSDSNVVVAHCHSKEIKGCNSDPVSEVNPASVAYGFQVADALGPVRFIHCSAEDIIAPRFAIGYEVENSNEVLCRHTACKNIIATSKHKLSYPREAIAFNLENAHYTRLSKVSVDHVRVEGKQKNAEPVGIYIDSSSSDTTIVCPKISEVKRGYALINYGSNIDIKGCK